MRLHFLLLCTTLMTIGPAISQNQTGNIVQYFGKEKIEDFDTTKNQILHTFHDGLVLNRDRFYLNSETTPATPVISNHLLMGEEIYWGMKVSDQSGEWKWDSLQVNGSMEFTSPGLRAGYLYVEYVSEENKTVLLDASGHTMVFVNGLPHEGDHYDFGYMLVPIPLKKGKNTFLFTGGRFPRIRARLISPKKSVQITKRDMTLPDILVDELSDSWGAIRIINTSDQSLKGAEIITRVSEGRPVITDLPSVAPGYVRKVPFKMSVDKVLDGQKDLIVEMEVKNARGETMDQTTFRVQVKSSHKHHKKTFRSEIDGSIQYYSVAPSLDTSTLGQGLFLSVHGASVEAVNQANAYDQKDWGHLVAPTNRRPYGFAWEDWGRIDALEVLEDATKIYAPDPQKIYLTGHSMGGHGTWYLGATYPDKWGGIAPAAGYPDLLLYRNSFVRRLRNMSDSELAERGMTRAQVEEMAGEIHWENSEDQVISDMIFRGGNFSRTLSLKRNYLHYPVYILHGEKDTVVPTFIAREMNDTLATFHPNYTYYEYPDGTHWYGDHSVDWGPIFDMFKQNKIKRGQEIDTLEFYTASPGVSAQSNFLTILQQESMLEVSSFTFIRGKTPMISTENMQTLKLNRKEMGGAYKKLTIDDQKIKMGKGSEPSLIFQKKEGKWNILKELDSFEKNPLRNGGFKHAFTNRFVLVYGTGGSREENQWNYQRALFDAEKFYYRANGNVEILSDEDFSLENYPDRNVILYGNRSNITGWDKWLRDSPIQFSHESCSIGDEIITGSDLGGYFIYPRSDSDIALFGVVSYTGIKGAKASFANHYLVNGTTFPDFILFNSSILDTGIPGVLATGFFDNDWTLGKDWVMRSKKK